MYIDTHAHLFMTAFDRDRDAVIQCASENGIGVIIDVGIDMETSCKAIENAHRYEIVFAAAGFHPHEASLFNAEEFENFVAGHRGEIIALGEFGLDFYRDLSPRPIQKNALRAQITIAQNHNLPLILHCRNAYSEMFEILNNFPHPLTGVMHCYSGNFDDLKIALDMGLHISVGGPLTYPNSRLRELIKFIPADRILLETDAPYLPPQAFRGKRNEPSYMVLTAGVMADTLGIRIFQVRDLTTENACRLFSLPIK